MTTAYEKEQAAAGLRRYAGELESVLDDLPAISAEAWDCPAADAFVAGVREQDARLAAAAATLRSVAAELDEAAAAQRAATAAAALQGGGITTT